MYNKGSSDPKTDDDLNALPVIQFLPRKMRIHSRLKEDIRLYSYESGRYKAVHHSDSV
jgi:hypothetical protein